MEQQNLEKALDIYAALITGQEISAGSPQTRDLYEEFYSNAAVYEIVTQMMKKLNLSLYEYQDAVYLTAGEGNRVFGYTNDDVKRLLGLRVNRELYLVYFIMYNCLLLFYQDSATYQVKEYVRTEDVIKQVTENLSAILKDLSVYAMAEAEADSFRSLALLWDELPLVTSEEKDKNRASRASRTGYVKLTVNFLQEQELFVAVEDRYYPTKRFHAVVQNYFEEYKGKIYKALEGEKDA